MPTIVGSIMIPRIMETVSTLFRSTEKVSYDRNYNYHAEKAVYNGRYACKKIYWRHEPFEKLLGQNFAINMAVKSPIGTPIIIAPAVQ